MKLSFEIQTPNSCVECRFHELKTDGRYGKWIFRCLLDENLIIQPRDGVDHRDPKCPGKETEDEDSR